MKAVDGIKVGCRSHRCGIVIRGALAFAIAISIVVPAEICAQDQADLAAGKAAQFEVASIRMIPEKDIVPLEGSPISPSGAGVFTMRQVPLAFVIHWAFQLNSIQLAGWPDWLGHEYCAISAKPAGNAGLSYEQLQPLVQQLLRDRFHLTYHRATQSRNGYALVVAKRGPKLTPAKGGTTLGMISPQMFDRPIYLWNIWHRYLV